MQYKNITINTLHGHNSWILEVNLLTPVSILGLPIIVNITVLNGMGVVGTISGKQRTQLNFIGAFLRTYITNI